MSAWIEKFVVKNPYSRPGTKLVDVRGIVMHWTADFGATDENEQKFFDGSDGGGGRYASAHLFVDSDSATLIIPLEEVAYHANEKPCKVPKLKAKSGTYQGDANLTTIGIEMCVEKDGTIHKNTISRSVDIAVELCKKFNLDPLNDIYMHHSITGKLCPRPWVEDQKQFIDFKKRVNEKLNPKPEVKLQPTIVQPQLPMFKDLTFKNGQIGLLTVLKPINLWQDGKDGKLEMVRILQPKEKYRVYGWRDDHGGQWNVGGTWVTKIEGYCLYETPSKQFIQQAAEFYANQPK